MTTTARHLTHATMIAALLAAAFTAGTARAAEPALRVVQLAPVVVVAKRIPVVQLERVVVVAKRVAPPSATVIAQRNGRGERV